MNAPARHKRPAEPDLKVRPSMPLIKRRWLLLLAAVLEIAWIAALVALAMR